MGYFIEIKNKDSTTDLRRRYVIGRKPIYENVRCHHMVCPEEKNNGVKGSAPPGIKGARASRPRLSSPGSVGDWSPCRGFRKGAEESGGGEVPLP
ncbi:hypothetical protein [Candidatus Magnetobacterium casense]|uniref:Uncharacterized protein n=1 Tax=Candidatus Magnetobacterium casense TaxID=1455061 RepID=A0ABS6RYL2_9BACT|nr:hypothetical protein [Candidatus Magnetobacterium casensis]MBV6341735.1 hypothetical protein [Candidatus Magnetobacterium casensis]